MSKVQKDIQCQNCGYPLHGDENYCPYCSQKNDIRPLSIKNYFQNVLGNFLNFDHKIWRTIIHLFKYPAKVPLDYIHGKRVRYSNPFRFLVQVSIIYFLLAGIISLLDTTKLSFIHLKTDNISINGKELTGKKQKEQKIKDDFYKKFDSLNQSMHFTSLLNRPELSTAQKDSIVQVIFQNKILDVPQRNIEFDKGELRMESLLPQSLFSEYLKDNKIVYTYYPPIENKEEFEKKPFFLKAMDLIALLDMYPYKDMNVNEIIKHLHLKENLSNKISVTIPKRILMLINNPESRDAYKRSVTSKITLGLFFVLPLFGWFVYLLYYKQGFSYTETLVFIFYLQSVYFMVLTLELFFTLLPLVAGYYLSLITELWFIYFLVKNFKAFYRQKTLKNILKVNLLVIPAYLILTGIGLFIISVLSLII